MDNFTGDKVHFEPTSEPSEGPYKVSVDDHSDDYGTVYLLSGPNVGILGGDLLKYRAEDFNLGYAQGRQSMQAEAEALKSEIQTLKNKRDPDVFSLLEQLGREREMLVAKTQELIRANQRWEKLLKAE